MRITQHSPFAREDDPETVEKIRKGRGRFAAYGSSKPGVRREVRLTGQTELRKVLRAARALKVTLQCHETVEELHRLAYENYAAITLADGRTPMDFHRLHLSTKNRLTVNYLRHARTVYDASLLRNRFSTTDLRSSYNKELKVRCLDEIASAYPQLADECDRQRRKISQTLEEAAVSLPQIEQAA
ncbi:hypothetical protein Achl_3957 (plasmid) [Pseudarthrobacter chlorophenolicus A6]|uniref:Uncharacterized protein n=1 Tax=Pseudarthrobacter chlorophenolicus (strain ATCC 700700 / DSM 12829 / CIP 107037 / JCM 12360 / KCTC 9906 / NCIMB 13794 / A6) TaxID=452863 RepID=B8HHL1_PSECP|nr:hypothetical protein [Pseudarthrobacter chlorophenolicus]ACL41908.1 hypothetical protein Achl_3957 [Pseudarthrobacter chlorophenolicus A6]SDQ18472.1 hypothetical protein SAMN04489738_0568 [Pseudarthrobacter chlorophenolicus]